MRKISFIDKFKETASQTIDRLSEKSDEFSLEKVNTQTRNKILNERFLPMLKNNGFDVTYDEIEEMHFSLNKLIMPSGLTTGFTKGKPPFVSNENAKRDNELLLQMTPILKQIDLMYEHYEGKPPAKYLRMDTYMSNERMRELGLTNEQRNYYISILFNCKKTTDNIPVKLRPYMYTRREEYRLVFKRGIPEFLRKEVELFYIKFYMTNPKEYPPFRQFDNYVDDLEKELKEAGKEIEKCFTNKDII